MLYPVISAATRAADEYTSVETAIGVSIWLAILAALWLLPTIIARCGAACATSGRSW
jgi:hypothetical protein